MDNNALLEWIQDNDIKAKTIEYFWDAFDNYKNKLSKEEFEIYFDSDYKKHIKLWFRSVSQRVVFLDYLDEENENINVIEARLAIGYKDDLHYGTYSVYYDFSGKVTDDTLSSEWEQWLFNLRKEVIKELKIEFLDAVVNEGIEHKLATTVINKTISKINKRWKLDDN